MPEFQLNTPARKAPGHAFYELNEFAKGYVEAMFFTNGDTADERENLLNDWGVERLTRAAVASIADDCAAFEEQAQHLLSVAYDLGFEEEQAGRDFWFTRQGHGVGFWEREELKVDVYAATVAQLASDPETRLYAPLGEPEEGATLIGNLGELLSDMARACREAHVEAYRGWIYHS